MNDPCIFQSLAVIEEKIHEKLTVEKLAESLHFSKYHYQRIFREAVGDSVMRYVTRRRLTLAAAELLETDNTVLDIALKYVFDSHEGFTRSFRAYIGVTPKEYRKYRSFVISPKTKTETEKCVMLYSKSVDEMIRELNGLIVQAKETGEYIRKNSAADLETAIYSSFWNLIADKTDEMADTLTKTLDHITSIASRPDEITARFIIVKIIEDAVFKSNTVSFQANLTVSRAKPEHHTALKELCGRLDALSHNARIRSAKIVGFFNELAAMIFADIRKTAQELIDKAVQKGRAAVKSIRSSSHGSYSYIAEEIEEITKELSTMTLEKINVGLFEDFTLRLDIIALSADMDALRCPSDKTLFDGISDFKKQLSETDDFLSSLSKDIMLSFTDGGNNAVMERTDRKRYGDLAFQENILLFYLKGEVQKLEPYLTDFQKAAFGKIYDKMNIVICLANHIDLIGDNFIPLLQKEMAKTMREIYSELMNIKEELGEYGSAVGYIAEELKQCSVCRCIMESNENYWL